MPKKRVYELAKELGLESKDLIARLEKIGIPVKAASSSLDEAEVERAKKELLAGEHREIVEQRIKSTVIRRRAVFTPVETPAEEQAVQKEMPTEKPAVEEPEKEVGFKPSAKVEKGKKEKAPAEKETAAPPEKEAKAEVIAPLAEDVSTPVETSAALAEEKTAPPKTKEKAAPKEVKPVTEITTPAEAQAPPSAKVSISAKPTIISKHKIVPPTVPRVGVAKATPVPAEKIIAPEVEKLRKKGKYQVEVLVEEEKKVPHRKLIEKKIEKRFQQEDEDQEVIYTKWREAKKTVPVKMKKQKSRFPKPSNDASGLEKPLPSVIWPREWVSRSWKSSTN